MAAVRETLRLMNYEANMAFEVDEKANTLRGSFGYQYFRVWGHRVGQINISYVKPKDENWLGRDVGNGSFTGLAGGIQRGDADASITMMPMYMPLSVLDYQPIAFEYSAQLGHKPHLNRTSLSLLETFNVFSPLTWSIYAMALGLICVTLLINSNRPRQAMKQMFAVLRCFVEQMDIQVSFYSTTVGILVLFVAAFSFTELIEALVHTESVSKDYSSFIHSLDDVKRRKNQIPCFLDGDPLLVEVSKPGSKHSQLWLRAQQVGIEKTVLTAQELYQKGPAEHTVLIGHRSFIQLVAKAFCSGTENRQFWIASDSSLRTSSAHLVRKGWTDEKRSVFNTRTILMSESGIYDAISVKGSKGFGEVSDCQKDKMDEVFDETDAEDVGVLQLDTFIFLAKFILGMSIVAAGALAFERILSLENVDIHHLMLMIMTRIKDILKEWIRASIRYMVRLYFKLRLAE